MCVLLKLYFALYVAFAKGIGVDLTNGFLFRPTSPGGEIVVKPFSYSPADPLLKAYLDESRLTPAGTPHGFRLG